MWSSERYCNDIRPSVRLSVRLSVWDMTDWFYAQATLPLGRGVVLRIFFVAAARQADHVINFI